jgi:hypothetical protein
MLKIISLKKYIVKQGKENRDGTVKYATNLKLPIPLARCMHYEYSPATEATGKTEEIS